jgi:hypothetical protein
MHGQPTLKFKDIVSFFYQARLLCDEQLKSEENPYLHCITESIYIT